MTEIVAAVYGRRLCSSILSALIERRPDESDRRVNRVFLTPRGRALQGPMQAALQTLNDAVDSSLGEFTPLFRAQLRQLARRDGA